MSAKLYSIGLQPFQVEVSANGLGVHLGFVRLADKYEGTFTFGPGAPTNAEMNRTMLRFASAEVSRHFA